VRPATPLGFSPATRPSGDSQHDRDQHRAERQLERRRHPLEDEASADVLWTERLAEIAAERAVQERQVLLPQRLVEAQRGDRALAVDLGRGPAG